ncbi:hypothetical protein JCM6882_002853 [Rhodosporidiobolus microsporus]
MSAGLTLVKHSVEERQRLVVTFDLDMDITDHGLDLEAPLDDFPWPGEWELNVEYRNETVNFYVWHDIKKVGECGNRVKVQWELLWISPDGKGHQIDTEEGDEAPFPDYLSAEECVDSGQIFSISPAAWLKAAKASRAEYTPSKHRSYRLILAFEQPAADCTTRALDTQSQGLVARLKGINLEQLPHDVRLFFPRAHTKGAELWAKSDFLSRSSPYLKDLLSSDFSESKPRRFKRARTSEAIRAEAASSGDETDYDDSDDETDASLFSRRPPKLEQSSEADDIPYRQITIKQTAFSTYHATLLYLQTGFIHFTPLSSSFPSSDSPSRADFLSKLRADQPSLPVPVSPKSAYRLAHLLQLDDLQARSLEAFRSSLSVSNAAAELFTDASLAYDELRAVVVEVVKANWAAVKETDGWKEKMAAIKQDEIAGGGAAVVELLQMVTSM